MPYEMVNRRVIIRGVDPEIEAGRYPIKRVLGERVTVEADVFTDGHEAVSGELLWRGPGDTAWNEVPLEPLVNDRRRATFTVEALGTYEYTITAWLDHFKFWSGSLAKRVDAGQDVEVDLAIGADLVAAAAVSGPAALGAYVEVLREGGRRAIEAAQSDELAALMYSHANREGATNYERTLRVTVDPVKARYSAWYEFFPRSCWDDTCIQGTFRECEQRLPRIAEMGFDIVYLPPIHPIGTTKRKGKNNVVDAEPTDVGSPWAIGSTLGGHKSVNPDLGTLEDFKHFVAAASEYGIDVAIDIAFQCSPDHPYVREHPEWFRKRPDGAIQYAENPPKKYEDIYPFDFDTPAWRDLWEELCSVVLYWVEHGVKIFRVDNPHTKALRFWEWLIGTVKLDHPEVIFLSEAFTRPKVMYYLAKAGFTQSYNYFAWRNTRAELTEYFTELTRSEVKEYFRPNLWPNTPDILTEGLQVGGRPAFISRLVLAATLGASYGVYGPAYELCVNEPVGPGKEEYLNSEKYEIKHWDVDRPDSLAPLMATINRIRRENPALHTNEGLSFHDTGNEQLIAYSKATPDLGNVVLTVVNLDPVHVQSGMVDLPLEALGIDPRYSYEVHDLLSDARYVWNGPRNYVELNPHMIPAHILLIERNVGREQDFPYYV